MNEINDMTGESDEMIRDEFLGEAPETESGSPEEKGTGDSFAPGEGEAGEMKVSSEDKKSKISLFNDFMDRFQAESTAEGKIRLTLDFMRSALSNSGTPRFRDFWEGRRFCLPLFKENISARVRSELWSSWIELSTEAKRLKEILDEQSAFAIEQIELAIQALERDLEHYDLLVAQPQETHLFDGSFSLKEKSAFYEAIQKELQLLGTLAARVNAMRKEVVRTEMRIRIKNRLLERLSVCGDKIFPKRKDLIRKISQEFVSDVEQFVQTHFQGEEFEKMPLYALREEIRQLQAIAKVLTLNTQAFTGTRLKLSSCWDQIRNCEKDRKKETQEKRLLFKQNYDLVFEKIKPFAESCMAANSVEACQQGANEILEFMKTLELGRDEINALKNEIFKAKRGPQERAREAQQERQRKEKEEEALRRDRINALKEELTGLLARSAELDVEHLSAKKEEISKEFEQIPLAKAEKQIVDRLFRQLKDAIDERNEKALLMLSEDDLKALEQLKAVLEERKARRAEIRNQVEHYRRLLGGSGFDFEKAMMYREIIETEKNTLEKINASISEIEEKIDGIEG